MSRTFPANPVGALLLAASASFPLLFGCAPPPADPADAADDHAHGSLYWTEFSQQHLVFVDYAPPAAGSMARFLAHFSVLETGAPVAQGEAQILLRAGGQDVQTLTASVSEQPGLFILEGFLPNGEYTALISLQTSGAQVDFPSVELLVHPDLAAAEAAAHALGDEEDPDAIGFSLEQQWTVGMLFAEASQQTLARRISVAGELEVPPAARAFVVAPFAGQVLAAGSSSDSALPTLGQRVQASDVVARIDVPLTIADLQSARASQLARGSFERDRLARDFEFEIQSAAAMKAKFAAESDLEFANKRLARIADLFENQLALARDLEEAEADVVRAELDLSSAEASLEKIESARRAFARSKGQAPEQFEEIDTGYPLRAPIAGEIASIEVALGQHVAQEQIVCEIINPDLIWLTAYVPEHDLAVLHDMAGAHVRLSAYPDQLFDLQADLGGKLAYKARVLDPETRTATVRYELANPDGILRGGMFADVLLASGAVENAVAIPESAIVQQDGLSVAFVMLDGEHFEKRVLRTGIRDGGMVEVKSGLQAGERVVTRGAYLVRLAASAPDSFGHGHAH